MNSENVMELMKMGWSNADSIRALTLSNNDLTAASVLLDLEQEESDLLNALTIDLEKQGWSLEAANAALRESKCNATKAAELLYQEENVIQENFEVAVNEMINSGWDEIVARQSLLAQWTLDQRSAAGLNNSVDPEVLKKIRPSLRKERTDSSLVSQSSTNSFSPVKSIPKVNPQPAKTDDVIFEVSANNFQKVVLDSPVPVILDIYADWCGPCKKLGPLLEDAAIRAGGIFRLVKLNADTEHSIVEALQVKSFPSVYAVQNGMIKDRFVGLLSGEKIQQFIIRAVLGSGDRVQPDELRQIDFESMTKSVSLLAGMASIDSRKMAKIYYLLENLFETPDIFKMNSNNRSWLIHDAVKVAIRLIENAANNITNPETNYFSIHDKEFVKHISKFEPAQKLLEISGFRRKEGVDQLRLVHKNTAILNLILQKIQKLCDEKKFAKLHQHKAPIESRIPSKDSARKIISQVQTNDTKHSVSFIPKPAAIRRTKKTDNSDSTLRNNGNEYFGGGSTVVLANVDSKNSDDPSDDKEADMKPKRKNKRTKK